MGFRVAYIQREAGMTFSRNILLVAIFLIACVTRVFATTEVTSITASPGTFNPIQNESTTITVQATPGVTGLEVRVLLPDQITVVRSGLALTETTPGMYTTTWDGKNNSNAGVVAGTYALRVYNPGTTGFVGAWSEITVCLSVSPTTFTPTGTNAATITVRAAPGQTGMKIGYVSAGRDLYPYSVNLPFTETSVPGTYTASWNAILPNYWIFPDATYSFSIQGAAGNFSATSGLITIAGVSQISAAPDNFSALSGGTTTITVTGVAGLNLQVKATKYNSGTRKMDMYRTMTMTGSGTTYTAIWDGKDDNGTVVPLGLYYLEVWHTDSSARYMPETSVQVSVGVSSVTASPSTFTPIGTNAATITVQATPGQTGLKVRFYNGNLYPYYWYGSNKSYDLPLTETSTPGTYTASWDGVKYGGPYVMQNGTYTIYVVDSGNVQSATTGQITITGISSVTVSPNQFTPGGNNFTTITAKGSSGQLFDARIINATTNALTRVLPLSEVAGTYTADWDGKDTYGNFAGANNYTIQIAARDSSIRYYPTSTIKVNVAVFTISASPDPFVPDGVNNTTITVRADALQSGLKATVSHPQSGTSAQLPLKESGSAGTYTTSWDGKINDAIPRDGTCTIRVYDSAGNQFPATGTFTLSSAKSLTVTPSPFEITGTSTATISAQMPSGLHLEARVGSLKTLPLTETSGTYSAIWDGKDSTGAFASSGTYNVAIWNVDTQTRYDLQTSLQVKIVDSVPPDTSFVSGPAEGAYVNPTNITFNWTGTDNLGGPLTYAYQLDSGTWSAFDSATSYTLTNLADGSHTFSVKAKDQAGNEDATPMVRHFTVDSISPQPVTNLIATPSQTGIRLSWTNSPSSDIAAYRIYWDSGTGTINYAAPFATVYYPSSTFTASIYQQGSYRYALRSVDKAGNEEKNTDIVSSATITGFSVSLGASGTTHKRGEDISITGSVLANDSTPLTNVPVTIEVESKGYVRTYSAYTKTNGDFSYLFQPLATEAGNYTVTVKALYQGLEKSASASFSITGMLMEPSQVTVDMSMNSPKTVNVNLRNIGSTVMSDLKYTLVDGDLSDPVKGFIDTANLPTSLASGASVVIPVLITAAPGTPPSVPPVFTLGVTASDGTSESAKITTQLHEAVSLPVVSPDPIMAGVHTGTPVTKTITITNQGYATMQDSTLTVHDPKLYGWVSISGGALGQLNPQEAKTCQAVVNPPEGTTSGTYVVQLDLNYNGTSKPVYMTVEVTTATVGQVAFKVHDDTGSVVSGAEVNLISKAFYVNVTPNGRQEYNNVIKGTTDQQGYILLTDVPAGDYRYIVNAVRHDQKDGLITVEPGSTPQAIGVIMVTNLVNVDFSVTPTTIQDQYNVNLNITYVTDLIKPTLYATPYRVDLSFFPEESPFKGSLNITNTSNNAPVRNLTLDASMLDGTDNEIKIVFDDGTEAGTQKINLGGLGFGQSIQVPYKAIIYGSNPKLNSRNLGNIKVTAEFDFSIEGKVEKSTTETPIPVLYWKPQELGLPGISYLNDETNNQACKLQYQGTTYRMSVKSNRNMAVSLDSLKAVNHVNGGPDAASIISSNSAIWTGSFTPTSLSAKGEITTFDIDSLQAALESRCNNDRSNFLGKPNFIGFTGTWSGRSQKDAYLIPISIITKSTTGIYIGETTLGGGSWVGGSVPTFNEHGTVKMQIDQKVSLEREAFDATLNIRPSVTPLDAFKAKVSITDENGNDASGFFQAVMLQKSGIASVEGSSVSGPVDITWQLIPGSSAGGTAADGKKYTITATIDYNFSGGSYTFTTDAETITVKPVPKLTIDYKLPYITMAGKPVKIKAIVKNNGYGPAHNLTIKSIQPKILENLSNVTVNFTLTGTSATPNDSTLQTGETEIRFGDIPAGGTVEGYWLLSTIKDGYFVEFTSTLTHEDYMGIQLDPLIEATSTHLIPAIGGEIFIPPNTTEGMKVELYQGGLLKGQDIVNAYGNYLIPDLTAGVYQWVLKDSGGNSVASADRDITVLDGQPTARIDFGKPEELQYTSFISRSKSARKLVLVTHGWNSSTDEWPNHMVSDICTKLGVTANKIGNIAYCANDEWEVQSYDWRADAAFNLSLLRLPQFIHPVAAATGTKLGLDILASETAGKQYDYIHFIAHSVGSNLIEHASQIIKSKSAKNIAIHSTFLDAYDLNFVSSYGVSSDWSDSYVDTRDLISPYLEFLSSFNFYAKLSVSLFNLFDTTDMYLPYAYNFDVTKRDPVSDFLVLNPLDLVEKRHGWPYNFYDKTIDESILMPPGFTLSQENGTNWLTASVGQYSGPFLGSDIIFPRGGACILTSSDNIEDSNCGCKAGAHCFTSAALVHNAVKLGFEILPLVKSPSGNIGAEVTEDVITEVVEYLVRMKTGSPVWGSYRVNLATNANTLQFEYSFTSGSKGAFSAYLDGSLVFRGDQQLLPFESGHNTGLISLGPVASGEHILTFRLDASDGTHSEATVSKISFGLQQLAAITDVVAPASTISSPVVGSLSSVSHILIEGVADDGTGSGVKTVEVSLDGGANWVLTEGTTTWKYIWNVPTSGTYTVLSRATDNAGNIEVPSTGVTFTVSLSDIVAPTGSIAIQAADNYTNSTAVTLALAANDPNGVTQMCISNSETCTGWQTFRQSLPWQLTSGDGLKTVRAWFKDGAGNVNGQPYTATVNLDTTAPLLSLSTLKDGVSTNNATLNISGSIFDTSGIKALTINDSLVQMNNDNSFSHALPLAVGANTVKVVATDTTGNAATDTRTITYDPNAPTLTITEPMDNSRTNRSFIDVKGSIDKNATVEVKVNAGQPELAAITDNSFTYTANLLSGTNTIEISATDLATNKVNAKRTVIYDNLKPSLAITDPAQDITTSQNTLLLKGTVSDALSAVTVTISVDGQTFTPAVTNGTFEQSITFTTAKSYAIAVTVTDDAMNSASVRRNVIYAPQVWNDVTSQVSITKSGTLYDPKNVCYFSNISVLNSCATPIDGALRLVVSNPTIPLKTNLTVGLKPDGYTATGEAFFIIVPHAGVLPTGTSISNLRINFEAKRVPLSYGVRLEQCK
jgi:flagellar hook assembly protein FlgD